MPAVNYSEQLKAVVESKGLKFHLKAGNAKWECTIRDRQTHEKLKAERGTSSSASVSSGTSSSSSSIKSQ
ncbi:hypothetical protein VTH82DRAFT_4459 [Thermothelomyces myriococcoides]